MALIVFINTKALVRSIQGRAGVFTILHHNEVRVLYILGYITTFAWDLFASSIASQITEPSKNFVAIISIDCSCTSFDRILLILTLTKEGAIERCVELFRSSSFATLNNLSHIHLGPIED